MKQSCKALILCSCFLSFSPVWAGISFSGPDLNSKDQLLFTVETQISGTLPCKALFTVPVTGGTAAASADAAEAAGEFPTLLTCYPERMELLSGGTVLQVRNRYGTARYDLKGSHLEWSEKIASIPVNESRRLPVSVSPDGKWACYVKKTHTADGPLIIENTATRAQALLSAAVPVAYDSVPVRWAPDSSVVIYENGGSLYFCSPDAMFQNIQMAERFRRIGTGTINSVQFTDDGSIIYIDNDVVYNVNLIGLYTAALYGPFVDNGNAAALLPLPFNPRTDSFAVNSSGSELVVITGGKLVSHYRLEPGRFTYVQSLYSEPFVDERCSAVGFSVIWPRDRQPMVKIDLISLGTGTTFSRLYTISGGRTQVGVVDMPQCAAVSADRTRLAVGTSDGVVIYSVPDGRVVDQLTRESVISLQWDGNSVLYVGGEKLIQKWDLDQKKRQVLYVSSPDKARWNIAGTTVVAEAGGGIYEYSRDARTWLPATMPFPGGYSAVQNGRYRVYVDKTQNALYENALYVRTLSRGAVTRPLLAESVRRQGARRKVALVFDVMDNKDGLCRILASLASYKLRCTFFINGDFIRKYPLYANQIAVSGQECASLFYTAADLLTDGFSIDETFIRRGLARNEDEFYACTGKELSLLWHAPFYRANDVIIKAGESAGYMYVNAAMPGYDTVTLEQGMLEGHEYLASGKIIDRMVQEAVSNGRKILAVSAGISRGSRTDYVYDNLDLLINELIDAGYEIVPVSGL